MIAANFSGGQAAIRLFEQNGSHFAEISTQGRGTECACTLPCNPANLHTVTAGIRYHIAGAECVCTVARMGDHISFIVKHEATGSHMLRVPIEEYERALAGLQHAPRPHAYVA